MQPHRSFLVRRGAWVAAAAVLLAAPQASAAWTPGPEQFGTERQQALPVTMQDGTILRADVTYPTDKQTGKRLTGKLPVLLYQSAYGKVLEQAAPAFGVSGLVGNSSYFAKRGYITVDADVRGTGRSQGSWEFFSPQEGRDGAELAEWAAKLPGSSGKVGLTGSSYLGIIQLLTAESAGPNSSIKAIFPGIAANDLYRDTAFAGGIPGFEFNLIFLGLTGTLHATNPLVGPNADTLQVLLGHLGGITQTNIGLISDVIAQGGDRAYDDEYWTARSPAERLDRIVANKIPAFFYGGWYDLFQRGGPMSYAALQNVFAGRPAFSAMDPKQKPTARYQLLQGPEFHSSADRTPRYRGLTLDELQLAWFDHWLKDVDTGIQDTDTPLHLWDLGTKTYRESTAYPLRGTRPTSYYLGADGTLAPEKPTQSAGQDQILQTVLGLACTSSTDQYAAGLPQPFYKQIGMEFPCDADARLSQSGPGQASYTTAPVKQDLTIAGPIGATLYATSTTTETQMAVQVSDVAPDGTARPITSGLLAGSHRAIDDSRSWKGSGGNYLQPYHPYTRAASAPVEPGKVTRFDIEVFPTTLTLRPGHRLRVTINSTDFPRAFPNLPQLANLIGGVYQIQRTATAPSSVELPIVDESSFGPGPSVPPCTSKRRVVLNLAKSAVRDRRLTQVRVTIDGRRVKTQRVGKRGVRITLAGRPLGRYVVRVSARAGNSSIRTTRRYRTCTAGKRAR